MARGSLHGKICYLEIPSADIPRSTLFYRNVFGWKTRTRGDGATAFDDATGAVSGSWVSGRPVASTPGLLPYVMVDSVSETSEAVVASGGRIVQPLGFHPSELIALVADPDGNVLGLYQEPNASSPED